jgi:rhodanese-related sulfurtransferase/biotin operon repressor
MSSNTFKSRLFDQFARIGKALSNGVRLQILELLAQGERSVEALAKASGQSVANVSQHLQQLRQSGLVVARKEGQFVFYRAANDDVIRLLSALQHVGEANLAEIDRMISAYLTRKDALEPVPAQELMERMRLGLVTVLDVRPRQEYEAGHLPGAISVPLNELEKHLSELPADREIVAYCRGPYCLLAFEAVATLREKGLRARRLEDGYPEWRLRGLPVESGRSAITT